MEAKWLLILLIGMALLLAGCIKDTRVSEKHNIIIEKIIENDKTNREVKINNDINNSFIGKTKELSIKSYETRSDGAIRITDGIHSAQNGVFSQDSKKILFTHLKSGYNKGEADLKILDLETGEIKTLLTDGNSNVNLPSSSWIGDKIIFSSTREPHDEIYIIDIISKKITQITSREDYVAYEPSFSPDRENIVFESHELDVEEGGIIIIYNIEEGTYTEITSKNEDSRQPNWSPKGDLILYQKLKNNQWDIWIYNISSRKEFKLTSGEADKTDASFSPDGKWIVYSSNEGGEEIANLYVQSIDSTQRIKVTDYGGYDGAPSWSYNNKYIIFESTPAEPDSSIGSDLWIILLEDLNKD